MEMIEFSIYKAIVMFIITILVSFIGASTGGSAMVSVPMCIILGLPANVSVATTRVSAFFSMLSAFFGFSKHKKIDYKIGILGAIISSIGAYFGSSLIMQIPHATAKTLIGALMLVVLAISLLRKHSKNNVSNPIHQPAKWKSITGYIVFFFIGCLGGAFGGQGVMLVYTLTLLFEMDFILAAGTRVIISFFITLSSLYAYFYGGCIHWPYGITMAAASIIGTYLGAIYSIKNGEGLVEKIFEAIVIITSIKLMLF